MFSLTSPKFYNDIRAQFFEILKFNNFPKIIAKKILNSPSNEFSQRETTVTNVTNSPNVRYVSIPYTGIYFDRIKHIVNSDTTKIAAKSFYNNKMNFYSKLKDKNEKLKCSNLVYSINCNQCDGVYIGETGTYLANRVYRHKYDVRTAKTTTALSQHSASTGHSFDFENVKILTFEKNVLKRRILECIFINQNKNAINFRTDLASFNEIYRLVIS